MGKNWTVGNLSAKQGKKVKGYLDLETVEEKVPAILINGIEEGPKVLVVGGIHGCEYTSIDAAIKIAEEIDPACIKGQVVVLPIASPASFYARSIYVHPADGKNLNRMFPGKRDGSEAERLAYQLNEVIFKQMDTIIDLHGGDMIEALIPFTIYHITDDERVLKESKKMASLFEIDFVIGSKDQVPGSTYGCAAGQGIPAIIAEAGQQGILSEEGSTILQEGIKNILRYMGIMEGIVKQRESTYLSVFDWYRTDLRALWYPSVKIGDTVKKGNLLGSLRNEMGDTIKEVYSETNGIVLFLVTSLAVNINDPLLAVGA